MIKGYQKKKKKIARYIHLYYKPTRNFSLRARFTLLQRSKSNFETSVAHISTSKRLKYKAKSHVGRKENFQNQNFLFRNIVYEKYYAKFMDFSTSLLHGALLSRSKNSKSENVLENLMKRVIHASVFSEPIIDEIMVLYNF